MLLLFASLAIFATTASAQLLVQPVHPQGLPAAGEFSDAGCDPITAGVFQPSSIADNFTLATAAAPDTLSLWGSYVDQTLPDFNVSPPPSSLFTVLFHQDDAGKPGVAVATRSSIVARRALIFQASGIDYFRFDLSFSPVSLPAGTWWIEIFADTTAAPSPGCFSWRDAYADPTAGLPGYAKSVSFVPGSNWFTVSDPSDWSLVLDASLFRDGFESDDVTAWSSSSP